MVSSQLLFRRQAPSLLLNPLAKTKDIPQIKHYIGPDVKLRGLGYFTSEAPIGLVYDPSDMNLFKLLSTEFFEFIDVTNEGTASSLLCPVSPFAYSYSL